MKIEHLVSFILMLSISFISQGFALQSNSTRTSPNPTIGFNFTALTVQNCPGGAITAAPQNPTAGVGKTQFITSTYQALRSFNIFTGEPDGILNSDAAAFTGNSGLAFLAFPEDVWLLYHRFLQRWFFSCETNTVSELKFMVSSDATITPETTWESYTIPAAQINPLAPNGSLDYQQPAFDQNAWYNGVATFDSLGGNFLGSSLTVVSNSSILAGNPNITVFPGLFPEVVNLVEEGYAAPATNFDANPQFGYFVWAIYDAPASKSGNRIQLYRIIDAGSNTPTLGPLVTVTVPEFAWNGLFSSHKGNLFGSIGLLQNGFGTLNPYVHVRNHQLFISQDIQIDSTGTASITGDRIGIRWYQFDLTGDPNGQGLGTETASTVPVLIQSGTLFDDAPTSPLFYYLSALMTNKQGDLVLSFNVSGDDAYVNAGYAFRSASDPLGALREPVLTTNTQFPLNFDENHSLSPGPNIQRWGDQSTVVTDPNNDLNFWLYQPFAAVENGWGIQATQLIPAS